ncbi:hypothetical protein F5141DRAFT_1150836 [Pisolithus sp. B1]|nr:hypothetical protein F5141DRAFT_1150836 [Pisolithus sp. B1]
MSYAAMDRQQFFARPPAWRRLACTWRRKNLERIRGCFHMVANLHAIVGSEARDKCVEDLSATFGLEYLKNYVGEIRFFGRLPLIMQTQLCAEPAIGPVGVISLSAYLSNPSLGPRYALPNLLPKAAALSYPSTKKRKMQCEVESISQTLGFGLLQYACDTLLDAAEDNQGQVCHTDFDTVHVRSSVQKVQTLQAKLQATEDEDAQQALEEDITGEILWFCWRGIRSEIDLILAAAVTYVRNDADECYRAGLLEITEIIKRTSYISTNVETTYLRRVMHDAGIGVSKYGLWLEARAADAVTTMDRPG